MKLQSTNPAKNYEVIGKVDISTKEEIEAKVKKAHLAKKMWKEMPVKDRIRFFKKLLKRSYILLEVS